MFSYEVNRMIDKLARCTAKNGGCKDYGTTCPKGYIGLFAGQKTPSECRQCIVKYLEESEK